MKKTLFFKLLYLVKSILNQLRTMKKFFHFINYEINMKKKARRFENAKIFACHLINVKITMM